MENPPALPLPPVISDPQNSSDQEQLNALAIAHYVVGVLGIFFGLIPLIYVGLGLTFIFAGNSLNHGNQPPPPAFLGWIFAAIGGFFFFLCEMVAVCIVISGRCLHKRRWRNFSFVITCIACAWMPFGTILGVFTLIVLSRQSVRQRYAGGPALRL